LTPSERFLRACRQAARLTHEARAVMFAAEDAVEERAHRTRRALKEVRRRVEDLGDLKDEAIHQVKRHPLEAVGVTFGAGLVIGFAAGWFADGRRARVNRGTEKPPEDLN
jgi:ElaB/YqjD/DUF883 family membrane-anchored ribosome-binding protein